MTHAINQTVAEEIAVTLGLDWKERLLSAIGKDDLAGAQRLVCPLGQKICSRGESCISARELAQFFKLTNQRELASMLFSGPCGIQLLGTVFENLDNLRQEGACNNKGETELLETADTLGWLIGVLKENKYPSNFSHQELDVIEKNLILLDHDNPDLLMGVRVWGAFHAHFPHKKGYVFSNDYWQSVFTTCQECVCNPPQDFLQRQLNDRIFMQEPCASFFWPSASQDSSNENLLYESFLQSVNERFNLMDRNDFMKSFLSVTAIAIHYGFDEFLGRIYESHVDRFVEGSLEDDDRGKSILTALELFEGLALSCEHSPVSTIGKIRTNRAACAAKSINDLFRASRFNDQVSALICSASRRGLLLTHVPNSKNYLGMHVGAKSDSPSEAFTWLLRSKSVAGSSRFDGCVYEIDSLLAAQVLGPSVIPVARGLTAVAHSVFPTMVESVRFFDNQLREQNPTVERKIFSDTHPDYIDVIIDMRLWNARHTERVSPPT